ncbi:hypothetical protein [Kluyvera intermedia]
MKKIRIALICAALSCIAIAIAMQESASAQFKEIQKFWIVIFQ